MYLHVFPSSRSSDGTQSCSKDSCQCQRECNWKIRTADTGIHFLSPADSHRCIVTAWCVVLMDSDCLGRGTEKQPRSRLRRKVFPNQLVVSPLSQKAKVEQIRAVYFQSLIRVCVRE